MQLWRADANELLHTFSGDGEPLVMQAFSTDGGTLLATAAHDGQTRAYLWDTASGELLRKLDFTNDEGRVQSAAERGIFPSSGCRLVARRERPRGANPGPRGLPLGHRELAAARALPEDHLDDHVACMGGG
jgi:hypothetical protein